MNKDTVSTPEQSTNTVYIVDKRRGNALGIASFIFGFISIFILSPVFVPLALILGIIGVIKKQIVWSAMGIISAIIGFATSPILLGLFSLATIGAVVDLPETSSLPTASMSEVTSSANKPISKQLDSMENFAQEQSNEGQPIDTDQDNISYLYKNIVGAWRIINTQEKRYIGDSNIYRKDGKGTYIEGNGKQFPFDWEINGEVVTMKYATHVTLCRTLEITPEYLKENCNGVVTEFSKVSNTKIAGNWLMQRKDVPESDPFWIKFEQKGSTIIVKMDSYNGEGTFDGRNGIINWNNEENSRTKFIIDQNNIFHGPIIPGYDWVYRGVRK